MSRRKCCCADCEVFFDDFVNAAGPAFDANWDDRSGTWDYLGPGLHEDSGGGGVAICQTETKSEEMSVSAGGPRGASDIHGVICNFLNDNNYFLAEIEGITTSTVVRLYRRADGFNTLLYSETIAPAVPHDPQGGLAICFTESSFTVLAGEAIIYECDPEIHVGGKKAGLRNGGTSTIQYDQFLLENYTGNDGEFDGAVCCLKQCECNEGGTTYCMPRDLTLNLIGLLSCGSTTATIPLAWQPFTHRWESSGSQPSCANLDGGPDLGWALECDTSQCVGTPVNATFRLISSQGSDRCDTPVDGCLDSDAGQVSFTCSPLEIVFPLRQFSGVELPDPETCGCCYQLAYGEWYATVTE